MALIVIPLAAYLMDLPNNDDTWNSHHFVRAIKDDDWKGYGYVRVEGRQLKIQKSNADDALQWFGPMAAAKLQEAYTGLTGISIVPVPSKSLTLDTPAGTGRTFRMAQSLARALGKGCRAHDLLRWDTEIQKARDGGPRGAWDLYPHLQLIGKAPAYSILVDDVLTGGGHLRAACARLKAAGGNVVCAVCAGRTKYEYPDDAFNLPHEELDEYDPSDTGWWNT